MKRPPGGISVFLAVLLSQVTWTGAAVFKHEASLCPGAPGCEKHLSLSGSEGLLQENHLTAIWQSLVTAVSLRLGSHGDILDEPQMHPDMSRSETEFLKPEGHHPPERSESNDSSHGPVVHHASVHQAVLIATFIMVVAVYIAGWLVIVYNKFNPHEESQRAYIDEDGEAHPDTDEEAGNSGRTPQSSRAEAESPSPVRMNTMYKSHGHVTVNGDDLINDIGVSAMCIFPAEHPSSVTKLRNSIAVPLIALQSMCLQVGLLYFLSLQIVPNPKKREIPLAMVFIAIYLHFLNCIQELPFSYQLFHHLPDFHSKWRDLAGLGTVLISDAFVVPLMSFVLGALYLCTSRTIGDAILNAVAVAFIREIDNWILSLNSHTDLLAGKVKCSTVHIPVNGAMMRQISWCIIFVPVVPILSTAGMCFIGFRVLGL